MKITEFYGVEVYAKDKIDTMTLEYHHDYDVKLYMCLCDGIVYGEVSGYPDMVV